MARISTYTPDLFVVGSDRWIGSDWQSPTKLTKNFTADAVADYYNRTAKISTGQFAWQFEPYIPTQTQSQKTFQKIDYYNDTISSIDLAGVIRVAQLSLGNTEPFAFIIDQWLGKNMLVYKSGFPEVYGIYTVDSIVQDGYYYLMTISFVQGAAGTITKDDSVTFGLFPGNGTLIDVTATFPLLSSGGTSPNISVDSTHTIPTNFELANSLLGYERSIVSAAVTGVQTKTLTLTQQNGGTITATWTDYDTAPVTSVFGRTGAILAQSGDYTTGLVPESGTNYYYTESRFNASFATKTTSDLTEGTNLYFTNSRARSAISVNATGLTYINSTGVISLTSGYFIPTNTQGSNWTDSYNNMIVSASVTGVQTKTLTLVQQDGGTITTSWTDYDTAPVTSVFGRTGAVVAESGDYNTSQVTESTNLYFTEARARGSISVTANGLTYNSTTGVISLTSGYVIPTTTEETNWNNAYNKTITAVSVTGTITKTLTLTQQDGGTLTATWGDYYVGTVTSVGVSMPSAFVVTNSPITSSGTIVITGAGTSSQYIDGTGALQSFPSLVGFVPYTGATQNVNLGEYGISVGNVIYDTSPTNIPTAIGSTYWDGTDETLHLVMNGTTQNIGEDVFFAVKNQTGSTIPKGTAVRFAGTVGNSGRLLIAPFLANGTYPSKYFMGVTSADIPNGANGYVYQFGRLKGYNTSSYPEGTILYASTTVAGGYQTTIPKAPNNIVTIAAVVSSGNNGILFIRPTIGSNINEDEGVTITSPVIGDVITYNPTSTLWENKTIPEILGYTPADEALTLTINGTTYDLTANRSWSVGTVTSVAALTIATAGTDITSTIANGSTTPIITLNIPTASSINRGALSPSDWSTFNNKQNQLNGTGFVKANGTTISYDNSTYLTTISGITAGGELSGTYPNPTLVNSAVIAKVLTGLNVTGGSISATDSILQAFGKLQNQINALSGSVIYQGTWNASTNTPTLTSSVGTKGYYYIVNVAGSTNLNGITDWQIGDWAIFDGSSWQKVDNTDSVNSVNGYTGAVQLTTSDIPEAATPVNLYFTNTRAINATLTGYTSGPGTITSSDTILSAIQKLNGNISSLVTGVSSVFGRTGAVTAQSGDYSTTLVTEGTNLYYTNARSRGALSFSAGSGAYNSTTGVITIPTNTNQLTNGASFITLASLSANAPLSYNNTTGVFSISQANSTTNGYLSSTDWNTFNNKQNALGFTPIGGSGTSGYLPIFTASTTLSNSLIYQDGSNNVGFNTNSPQYPFDFNYTAAGWAFRILNTYNGVSNSSVLWLENKGGGNLIAGVSNNLTKFVIDSNGNPSFYGNTLVLGGLSPLGFPTNVLFSAGDTQGLSLVNTGSTGELYMSFTSNTLNPYYTSFSYNYTSNFLRFRVGGNEKMRIFGASGNVSIGNTLDVYPLNVTGDINTSGVYRINGTSYSVASTSNSGFLTSTDWNTFNNKQSALTFGNLTESTSSVLTIVGGTGAVIGSGTTIQVKQASGSQSGFLSSTDWTTFNNKQNALTNPITGTGTTNYLPKFTGSTTLGDSIIYSDGSNIAIGATSAAGFKLYVSGVTSSIFRTASATAGGQYLMDYGGNAASRSWRLISDSYNFGDFSIQQSTTQTGTTYADRLIISANGNVGIGTSSPSYKLEVSGTGYFSGLLNVMGYFSTYSDSSTLGSLGFNRNVSNGAIYNSSYAAFQMQNSSGLFNIFGFNGAGTSLGQLLALTSSGNLGLGVTPSAWIGTWKVFEIGNLGNAITNNASNSIGITSNAIITATGWQYGANGFANFQAVGNGAGQFAWYIAPSGTAGTAISFTQAMTLDASGNLFLGTTTSIGNATNRVIKAEGSDSSNLVITQTGQATVSLTSFAGTTYLNTSTNHPMWFGTNNTERMRITSGGNVGIGATTNPAGGSAKLFLYGGSGGGIEMVSSTNDGGLLIAPLGGGGSLFYTYTGALGSESYTERMRITSAGNVGIGTSSPGYKLEVSGTIGATGFYETSDIRLKEVIEYNPKVDLSAVKLIKYKMIGDDSIRYGYSAQDVKSINPDFVGGNDERLTLNYKDIHSVKIAMLEAKIAELELQLNNK